MILKSFAKINIGLKIINKRDDGFHNIETIYYPINFYDEIDFNIKKSFKNYNSLVLKSDKTHIPSDKSNTCYKAIIHFFKQFEIKSCFSISINITKNIPVGGGLGGGSSNAASTIKALTKYFNLNIAENREQILDVALSIGSDVPFFLISKPCFASGRGDQLRLLPDFKVGYKILLVNPNLHISTRWAYENFKISDLNPTETYLRKITDLDLNAYKFENDFETIVFEKYPVLNEIKNFMNDNGALYASLSGSGATMFGFFETEKANLLKTCYNSFKEKNYFTQII